MKKIFLLEDDFSLNETIKEMLNKSGFVVDSFYSGEKAFENILGDYALYILDINVPNIDGITILEKIKSISQNSKVIIISANIDINQITLAYEKDCDDYIKKPFDFDELIIRINAILKKQYHTYSNELTLDDFHFFIEKNELYKSDIFIPLTPYELKLVLLFFKNINTTLTKDFLIDSLDDFKDISEGALRVHITNLRKIGLPIATIKGIGYRFASS